MGDSVGLEDFAEGYDAFELVDVGAADYREDVEVVGAEPLEGEVEALVGVDVGEGDGVYEVAEQPGWGFVAQAGGGEDADDAAGVGDDDGGV